MLQKLPASLIALFLAEMAAAQDSTKTPAFSITGSADVYYRYEFNQTKSNNLTSFTNSHNMIELGMASVKLEHKTEKVDMVADLGFGKRAQEFSYNDAGILAAVKQLYISYAPSTWIKFTAGSWATHVGYDLVDAYANRNYSMSYMFTNGPFFHTGLKADISYKRSSFMIGVANPTDFKYVPSGFVNKKFLLAQYAFVAGDYFKAYLNYVSGEYIDTSRSRQVDLVLTSKLSDKVSLGYNGTINRTQRYLGNKTHDDYKTWWGSAVYVNFDPLKSVGITLREEYFSDQNQLKMYSYFGKGGSIIGSTLSVNFRVDNFIFIPEFRIDKASETIFLKHNGSVTKKTANVLVAAVYQF